MTIEIGLVYDRIRWEEKQLLKAAQDREIKVKMVDSRKESVNLLSNYEEISETFGDPVLQRCISYFRGLHLTAILESKGVRVVNSFDVSLKCGNKLFTTLTLSKAGVPVPETMAAFTMDGVFKALNDLGYPAVLKPVVGSWGRLMAILKDKETTQAIIELREKINNALLQIYYVQKWVDRPPRDIRVVVVGDEVVAASYRYSPVDDWRTNVARGGKSEACPITPELEEVALKAAEAVGGGVLAVDCMESREKGLLVHEVNNTVEFRGLASTTNVDIAGKIIEYVAGVVKR
ncbi:lysine biosynthesis protein LysX [Candidatus Bathyarchaeota archaeon B24-2]|nr:MAG: lysine biosynthesis protein LysX [Candidatus Bathyarchaeota archaeon B24-2]